MLYYTQIHKENNPGGPIINSTFSKRNSIIYLVRETLSYIKNTNDFVKKINSFKVLENSVLAAMDLQAL